MTTTAVRTSPYDLDNPYATLSLNTKTVNSWTLAEAVDGAASAGLGAVGLWRDRVQETGVAYAAKQVADAGLRVSSLCRGGFMTGVHDDVLDTGRLRGLVDGGELDELRAGPDDADDLHGTQV